MFNVDQAWADYVATRDLAARNRLVEHYLPIVERVATQLAPSLPRHVDQDDLVSYGTFGLIDAVTRFDPAVGAKFTVFAWTRIRGSMLDHLRRFDDVQRSLRAKARRIEQARAELTTTLRRVPTRSEVASALGMTDEQLRTMMSELSMIDAPTSINTSARSGEGGQDGSLQDRIVDTGDDVTEGFEIDELREVVAAAWNELPRRERVVLRLRYVEGLTLTESAEVLGVATSRVSQLATDAVRQLRSHIAVL